MKDLFSLFEGEYGNEYYLGGHDEGEIGIDGNNVQIVMYLHKKRDPNLAGARRKIALHIVNFLNTDPDIKELMQEMELAEE